MLFSDCLKEIEKGKEIQIKGSIICQNCVENDKLEKKDVFVTKCHDCSKLLSNVDIFHEISKQWSSNFSEKVIKCQPCYENSLKKNDLKRKWWVKGIFQPTN